MLSKKNIAEIEKIIGYSFKDKSLLIQAFTRSSYCNERNKSGGQPLQSNEVLEFFGDSILSAVIVTFLMKDNTKRYEHGIKTTFTEGDFSIIKSSLADKSNLSTSIMKLGLEEYLIMGEGDIKQNVKTEPSVREDLFESIIGAVYIDSGANISEVVVCVSKMLDMSVYKADSTPKSNSKNELQEWCADKKRRLPVPRYETVEVTGPEHKRLYKRACYIGDTLYGVGEGKNLKAADSAAAKNALTALKSAVEVKQKEQEDIDYHGMLRKLAADAKALPPEFHDLGEAEGSTEYAPKFRIECVCLGQKEIATGRSKREARALSAKALYQKLISNASRAKSKSAKSK